MGPFGCGKTYLGHLIAARGIAHYDDLEPLVYERFGKGHAFDVKAATAFLRQYYDERLEITDVPTVFESTGITQRPLLLDVTARHPVALVRVDTPRETCLERIELRNAGRESRMKRSRAADFFDKWTTEVAPTYDFTLTLDGTDARAAVDAIRGLFEQ